MLSLILLSAVLIVPNIFMNLEKINLVEDALLRYAQKNGGFVNTKDIEFNDFLDNLVVVNKLDKIIDGQVELTPQPKTSVQKNEKMYIAMTPKFVLKVPFTSQTITFKGKEIKKEAESHKFYKD